MVLVCRNGVLALALSSPFAKVAFGFNHSVRRVVSAGSGSSPSFCNNILHHGKRYATTVSDDPSLTSNTDFEWLKQSRDIRIHARLVPPNGEAKDIIGDASSANSKIVHFQRHAQGTHNELYKTWTDRTGEPLDLSEMDPKKNPLLLPDIIDAPLTQKGKEQCLAQRSCSSALEDVELVISSPLVRALQTAHITWEEHLPNKTSRDVKWIAHEGLREELGTLLCNKRQPLSETEIQFPDVDYSCLPRDEEDIMWDHHVARTANEHGGIPKRETIEDMSHRAYNFLVEFLHRRPEKEIVVVGHSAWLLSMMGAVLDVGEDESLLPMFAQAEMRSCLLRFEEQ